MTTENYEINLELADEDVADEMQLDTIARKKKGRGFQSTDRATVLKAGDYESLEAHGVGSAQRSVEGWIVLITGVHEEAHEEDLLEKFSEYGPVKNLHLNLDRRTGFVKGYALIEYETLDQAKSAIENSNGVELLGQVIHADFAFIRGPTASKSTQKSVKKI